MEKLSCKVIGDLLPLYADGACSEETKKLVEEHVEGCPGCRDLLLKMKEPIEPGSRKQEYTAKKAFRKVRRRWVASLLAVILLVPVALLTINQLTNNQRINFTNFPAVLAANSYVRHIKNGDIDQVFEGMKPGLLQKYEEIRRYSGESDAPDGYRKAKIGAFSCYVQQEIYDSAYKAYQENGDEEVFWAAMIQGEKGVIPSEIFRKLAADNSAAKEKYVNQIYYGWSFHLPRELLDPFSPVIPAGCQILPADSSESNYMNEKFQILYSLADRLQEMGPDQFLGQAKESLERNYRRLKSQDIRIQDVSFVSATTTGPDSYLIRYDLIYRLGDEVLRGTSVNIRYAQGQITEVFESYSRDFSQTFNRYQLELLNIGLLNSPVAIPFPDSDAG